MDKLIIEGGNPLSGEICVQGAKNAVLPILAATVMAEDECIIHNAPKLRDVNKTDQVLKKLGCEVKREGNTVFVNPTDFCGCKICEDLMREMRSSIIFLGAVISRCRKATVGMPGGCSIGLRPIDLHLKGLKELGVEITEEHGYINCSAPTLHGANIHLDFPSVGATENIMLASVYAEGESYISNAAREPEIVDLANFLNLMGARISGAGTGLIKIEGVKKRLHGAEYTVMPDRIVAATYLAAGAITDGEILLRNTEPKHMGAMIHVLKDMGAKVKSESDTVYLKSKGRLKGIHTLRTMPYPGFPTDIQSPFMSLAAVANGTSVFTETIFENRFQHVDELVRMGADIKVEGRSAVVRGVNKLTGARLVARELRGGAALVLASLAAEGKSEIIGMEYIDRGYEEIERYISDCGGKIIRTKTDI